MYSTVIGQQHMTDRTEQERLLLSFIAQKAQYRAAQSASWAQNDALEATQSQHTGCAALRVRIEKKRKEGRDIDK